MYKDLIRKIESYLDSIFQYINNDCWELAQSEWLLALEDKIKYELETYPRIVSAWFDDILSIKAEMDEGENGSLIYDIESSIEELICLVKEYECSDSVLRNDDYDFSECTLNSTHDETPYEHQNYLNNRFVSESKLKLVADIKKANEICQYIKETGGFITREKILREFDNTSVRALNLALSRKEILSYDSVYIDAENIHISHSAKQEMLFSLRKLARDYAQHNVSELLDYAKIYNNDFLVDAKISNSHQLYSVVAYFFSEDFLFVRPYFAHYGVRILSADDLLRKHIEVSNNYSIRALLDYAKSKKITVDNIVRVLKTFNDQYYIYDKERIIPIKDTGINLSCKQQLVYVISNELFSRHCVAIRDLEAFAALPKINVQWTEWLVYSVLEQMEVSTITVTLSSNRFKDAIPVVAIVGEDTAENIRNASAKYFDTSSVTNGVDNLDDLDLLLEDIIDFDVFEDSL